MYQKKEGSVAYFSLEVGLDPSMPLYSGGLGILAGDTLKSCADLGVPVVAVSLLYREGYFHQKIIDGNQVEVPVMWTPEDFLQKLDLKTTIRIEGRAVHVQAWQYMIHGVNGSTVPAIFLDADLEENSEWDRTLTKQLYGGDRWYRLCQEMILGIAGTKIIHSLFGESIEKYHMNEGHAAFLTLELLREATRRHPHESEEYYEQFVRERCVFTTHTPVPAGHDAFRVDFVKKVLGDMYPKDDSHFISDSKFNMTHLALYYSKHINGVAKKHRDVSLAMFPGYQIDAITNGIHSVTWTGESFRTLFDSYIPGWRKDNYMLRYALNIPYDKIWSAHIEQKQTLIDFVNETQNVHFSSDILTIGFARRAATYKRADLIFRDIARLERIAKKHPIQIVMAGKAHPSDSGGKGLIHKIHEVINSLNNPNLKVVFLPNYEMWLGQLLVGGVDVWLNTPMRPLEASGTSGMKAAHNGILNFSVLDGWWIEGHVEGVTGWSIGGLPDTPDAACVDCDDSEDLYDKLEANICPLYYGHRDDWVKMMIHGISHNASFFNTQRMVSQYVVNSWFD
jgi:starch phosphorylase